MHVDYQLLGKRVAQLRKKMGLTQEKLAERAEITNNYLSNIENCHSIPSLETVVKLCTALDVTADELLSGVAKNEKQYLSAEIQGKLAECTPEEKSLVYGFIELLLRERKKNGRTGGFPQ